MRQVAERANSHSHNRNEKEILEMLKGEYETLELLKYLHLADKVYHHYKGSKMNKN